MDQIEIILRTTASSGKVTEKILAKFAAGMPEKENVFQYSGLCIDPIQHQVSYQGKVLPLTETYEFQTLVYLARSARKSLHERNRSIRQSGKRSRWM